MGGRWAAVALVATSLATLASATTYPLGRHVPDVPPTHTERRRRLAPSKRRRLVEAEVDMESLMGDVDSLGYSIHPG